MSTDNMQMFATRGYAVLLPNAPQHLGTPMTDLMKTVIPGVDKAVELGIADPEKIGVMGISYGGYSTLALIVQTTRFKAAVMINGYGDLLGHYGQLKSDGTSYGLPNMETGQGLMGGTPWEYRSRYVENSPIFYLDKVQTPILIISATEDSAVSDFLGDQVFVALRRLGKEAAYAKYIGEDHGPLYWSYANQVDYLNRITQWFDEHLK
jgi:dipeptidyl aminopeptidase/acylaminoacyl peptidase